MTPEPLSQAEPPRKHGTARWWLREKIQRGILGGEYAPGEQLRQIELARRYEVAQSVVREALLELSFSGLVRPVENVGMFVSDLGAEELLQAYEIREVLEGLAGRLCCDTVNRANLRDLRRRAERIHELGEAEDWERMGTADHEFHHAIIRISHNEVLDRLTDGYRILGMVVRANRDIDEVYGEHLAIVDALEANEGEEAERLARSHVRAARDAMERQIAREGFHPRWVVDDG